MEERRRKKLQKFLLPFPILLLLLLFIFFKFMFCWNFCTSSFLLALRCVFLSFSLAFHAWMKDCCCKLLKAVRVLFCHEFMFNWHGISRGRSCFLVYMKEVRSTENRTPRVCLNSEFSRCNTVRPSSLWNLIWFLRSKCRR